MSERLLRLEGIRFSYRDRQVLRGVDLALEAGDRVALVGANGSGKTTLLRILVGLLRAQAGRLELLGRARASEADFRDARRRIGMVLQDADDQLFCPTVEEDVAFGPVNLGWPRDQVERAVQQTLDQLDLSGYAGRLTHRLSMGEKRRVALATVLAMRPELLLLDEPSANLDGHSRQRLADILEARDETVLLISHDVPLIRRLCRRVVVLADGAVAADGPADQLLDDKEVMSRCGIR